jgi:hypothetical protein
MLMRRMGVRAGAHSTLETAWGGAGIRTDVLTHNVIITCR